MFKVLEDLTILCTRGDVGVLEVTAENESGGDFEFQAGDVVRLEISARRDCRDVVLQKDVTVAEATNAVEIELSSSDTRFGEVINSPVDYWYWVERNPEDQKQTLIGYGLDGPKVFTLLPEADGG